MKKKQSSTSKVFAPPPSCPSSFGLINYNTNISQAEDTSVYNEIETVLNDKDIGSPSTSYNEQHCNINNIPIILEEYTAVSKENVPFEEKINVEDSIKQMLRMQAACNITLRAMNQRLVKIENAIKHHAQIHVESDNNIVAPLLPLTTVENIKHFDSLLKTSDESLTHFKQILLKTGGNNAKDNIYRCLQKILTNECAMKCSWKGLRNNFRIADLYIIKIMRKIMSHYNCTDVEFDNTVAEWLRFAKQRGKREKNKENIQEEEN